MTTKKLRDRIDRQRERLGIKPWEVCPLEVDFGPCPWPPGTGAYESWQHAQALKRKWRALRAAGTRDPLDVD